MAEEIDVAKLQFSELQKVIDLGSGQGHICMHNICMTTSIPNHVTVASCLKYYGYMAL